MSSSHNTIRTERTRANLVRNQRIMTGIVDEKHAPAESDFKINIEFIALDSESEMSADWQEASSTDYEADSESSISSENSFDQKLAHRQRLNELADSLPQVWMESDLLSANTNDSVETYQTMWNEFGDRLNGSNLRESERDAFADQRYDTISQMSLDDDDPPARPKMNWHLLAGCGLFFAMSVILYTS